MGKKNIRQSQHRSLETNSSSYSAVLRRPRPPLPKCPCLPAEQNKREIDISGPPTPHPSFCLAHPASLEPSPPVRKVHRGAFSHGLSACETHKHTRTPSVSDHTLCQLGPINNQVFFKLLHFSQKWFPKQRTSGCETHHDGGGGLHLFSLLFCYFILFLLLSFLLLSLLLS